MARFLSIVLTLVVLLSACLLPYTQADRDDHSNHGGGSGGGNSDVAGQLYESCNKHEASCVGGQKGLKGSSKCWASKNCDYLVTIQKHGDKYKFALFGKVINPSSGGYVAVGISKDGKQMAKTSIVECKASTSREGKLVESWSETKGKPEELRPSTYIHANDKPHLYGDLLTCDFERDAKSNVKGNEFDLDNEKYKVLLAIGQLGDDGEIEYHNQDTVISDYMLLKTANTSSRNVVPSAFIILVLALLAWH